MQIPHSFEYNSQKSINELYGNIPLFISDDGYAAYRRGLRGILGEYALEWKTNLSALRLYLRALLQTYSEWGKGMYKFKDCRCRCIVRHGTMFEGSNLPLQKWFYAICLFLSCKKDKQLSVGERDSRYFLLLRRKCAKAQSLLQTT